MPGALKSEAPCPPGQGTPTIWGSSGPARPRGTVTLLPIVRFHPWEGRFSLWMFIFPLTFGLQKNINTVLINLFLFFFKNKEFGD